MLALLLIGCHSLGPLYVPADHAPPDPLVENFAARDPAAVFTAALDRLALGDVDGAIQRLVWLRLAGDDSPQVLYQLGVAYEAAEAFETALSVYDLLLEEDRDPGVQRDAGFRRAQVLEALGRHEEALRQLKRIRAPSEGFNFEDRQTYDVQLGVSMIRAGAAGGEERIRRALTALEGTDETYIQAKGWYGLVEYTLMGVADLPLTGRERRVQKNLERRAGAILDAEALVGERILPLQEPQWILAGVLAVGDAYADLGRDVYATPPPRRLTDDQAAIYTDLVRERAAVLIRKAWSRYDSGLSYARGLGLENRYTRELAERRDGLDLEKFTE